MGCPADVDVRLETAGAEIDRFSLSQPQSNRARGRVYRDPPLSVVGPLLRGCVFFSLRRVQDPAAFAVHEAIV